MSKKINAAERFIIRNHTALRWSIYFLGLAALLVFVPLGSGMKLWLILLIAFALAVPMMLIDLVAVFKLNAIERLATDKLDLKAACAAADEMIAVCKKSQLEYIGAATLLKATALYDMGKKDGARKCIFDFFTLCEGKKRPAYAQMAESDTLLAIMALCDYDFDEFSLRKDKMTECINKCRPSQRRYFRKNSYEERLELDYRLYSADGYDTDLENGMLERIFFTEGKEIPKSKRTVLSDISTYSMLCDYFGRLDMTEKLHYYYRKIQRLANEQFAVWHEAKEYLDNENIVD